MVGTLIENMREKFLRLSIGATLSIILVLGLIPTLVMGEFFVSRSLQDVDVIKKEREGNEFLRHIQPVDNFITDMPSDPEIREEMAKKNWQLLSTSAAHDNHSANMASQLHVKAVLDKLRIIMAGDEADPRVAMDALITRIGDQSGLILDPELDSYYLMDIVLLKSRKLALAAEELERVSAVTNGPRDPLLLISRHRVADAARDLQSAMVSAVKDNKDGTLINSNVVKTVNATITASNNLVRSVDVPNDRRILSEANKKSWAAVSYALDRALDSREEKIKGELYSALAVCGVVLLVAMLMAGIVIAAITGGLARISKRLDELSNGDVWSPVPGAQYHNDIGVIAQALQDFIGQSGQLENQRAEARAELEATVSKVRQENEELLANALEQQGQAQEFERQAIAKLASDLEAQVSGLLTGSRTAADQMDVEATAMADSTSGVQREAAAAASAANEIRRTVQAVAPIVEAVSQQLDEYTVSLGECKTLAADAVKRMGNANQRMEDFNQATSRASQMLTLIGQVAHKTNMLALNASIEAVRVGEAGQGFMVVAEEVKALALSTRNAARDIASQITAMEGANNAVVNAFGEVIDVVNVLATQSDKVVSGMNQQTESIGKVEDVIVSATDELSVMVQSMDSADASATAAMQRSSEMMAASRHVSANVGALDTSVRDFLGGVREARQQAA